MTRRWELTDMQRLLLLLAIATGIFLLAMALGGQNLWLLITGVGVPGLTIVSVLIVALRRGSQRHEVVTAQVLEVSAPPAGAIVGRCDLRLLLNLPGRGRIEVKARERDLAVTRWPHLGQSLPVDVTSSNPQRSLRIRWDLVDQGFVPQSMPPRSPGPPSSSRPAGSAPPSSAPSPSPPSSSRPSSSRPSGSRSGMPEDLDDIPVSLTPPRPRRGASAPAEGFFETFADTDEPTLRWRDDPTVRTPPHPSDAPPPPPPPPAPPIDPAAAGNGHDPDGLDLDDFEPARLESVAHPPTPPAPEEFEPIVLPEFDPADVDRRDFGEAPPAAPFDDDDEEYGIDPGGPVEGAAPDGSAGTAAASIPQPRTAEAAEAPDDEAHPDEAHPDAEASEPGPMPADVSAVLGVDDLERSLRFYGEILGFTIIYTTSRSALVESGRTRILLEQGSAPRARRSDQPQLQVSDVQARFRDLQARGVEFPEPPRALSSGDDLELWLARLRDPDGHELELIEWRQNG